jgi:hypothetical protein
MKRVWVLTPMDVPDDTDPAEVVTVFNRHLDDDDGLLCQWGEWAAGDARLGEAPWQPGGSGGYAYATGTGSVAVGGAGGGGSSGQGGCGGTSSGGPGGGASSGGAGGVRNFIVPLPEAIAALQAAGMYNPTGGPTYFERHGHRPGDECGPMCPGNPSRP